MGIKLVKSIIYGSIVVALVGLLIPDLMDAVTIAGLGGLLMGLLVSMEIL